MSSLGIRVIGHLRQEGQGHRDRVDGVVAALKVYADSSDKETADAAQDALSALTQAAPAHTEEKAEQSGGSGEGR